jgi:hypothetical protein
LLLLFSCCFSSCCRRRFFVFIVFVFHSHTAVARRSDCTSTRC